VNKGTPDFRTTYHSGDRRMDNRP